MRTPIYVPRDSTREFKTTIWSWITIGVKLTPKLHWIFLKTSSYPQDLIRSGSLLPPHPTIWYSHLSPSHLQVPIVKVLCWHSQLRLPMIPRVSRFNTDIVIVINFSKHSKLMIAFLFKWIPISFTCQVFSCDEYIEKPCISLALEVITRMHIKCGVGGLGPQTRFEGHNIIWSKWRCFFLEGRFAGEQWATPSLGTYSQQGKEVLSQVINYIATYFQSS